jgi:hypothetical protein
MPFFFKYVFVAIAQFFAHAPAKQSVAFKRQEGKVAERRLKGWMRGVCKGTPTQRLVFYGRQLEYRLAFVSVSFARFFFEERRKSTESGDVRHFEYAGAQHFYK